MVKLPEVSDKHIIIPNEYQLLKMIDWELAKLSVMTSGNLVILSLHRKWQKPLNSLSHQNCPKVQPDPAWECCLGTKCACGCLILCGLQGDNPVSPGVAKKSHSTASSSVITDMSAGRAVSLPFFPLGWEENLSRQFLCSDSSSMHFWDWLWLAGTGSVQADPAALTTQTLYRCCCSLLP